MLAVSENQFGAMCKHARKDMGGWGLILNMDVSKSPTIPDCHLPAEEDLEGSMRVAISDDSDACSECLLLGRPRGSHSV